MSRTIHGLEALPLSFFVICGQQEQIIFVVFVVATDLPQVDIKYVRGNHFFKVSSLVLKFHQIDQFFVDDGPVRQEKSTARCELATPKE